MSHPLYTPNPWSSMAGSVIKPGDIEVCDVTLRDGEQMPGVVFTRDEKVDIALMLDDIGVEVVEAGFPVVSEDERASIKAVTSQGLDAKVCCLSRALSSDVEAAVECDVDVVSIFIAVSDLHLRYKYGERHSIDDMVSCAIEAIDYAKEHDIEVRFALEDASRTDLGTIKHVFSRIEEVGVDYLSVADTVGILNPTTTKYFIDNIMHHVHTPLCIHCHNDLGMATANTISAAEAGVFQLHTTVNGIGERAGNTPLEELLLALYVGYGIDRYRLDTLYELSKKVSAYSKVDVSSNKPIVGQNAFTHESGIHVAAILKNPRTYELFDPTIVGRERTFIVGKHTGRKALHYITERMGYSLSDNVIDAIMEKVKECSDIKEGVSCERLKHFIEEAMEEEGGETPNNE